MVLIRICSFSSVHHWQIKSKVSHTNVSAFLMSLVSTTRALDSTLLHPENFHTHHNIKRSTALILTPLIFSFLCWQVLFSPSPSLCPLPSFVILLPPPPPPTTTPPEIFLVMLVFLVDRRFFTGVSINYFETYANHKSLLVSNDPSYLYLKCFWYHFIRII